MMTAQPPATKRKPSDPTKLAVCDLAKCEGICCTDGAFLLPEEEALIHKLVKKYPNHFPQLPADYIADSEWEGNVGRKTATYSYNYKNKPAHFKHTRCAFTEADGKCGLQTLAVAHGKHKWDYKPMGCWLFPLSGDNKGLVAPPRSRAKDPNNLGKHYPGFVTATPCGTHAPKGRVWWMALREEVNYYRKDSKNEAS